MVSFGGWEVYDEIKGLPEKVATAMGNLETLLGATYTPVGTIAQQVVNGTNYAVLAEQTVITGVDIKNAVAIVFNEKPGSMDVALVAIQHILDSGAPLGGVAIDVTADIPEEAQKVFDEAIAMFVGSGVTPLAYLGSQVVRGTDYKFLVKVTPVTQNPQAYLAVLTVNDLDKSVLFENVVL